MVGDPRGVSGTRLVAKMHLLMNVHKESRSKNRRRFIRKALHTHKSTLSPISSIRRRTGPTCRYMWSFSRFVLENLALFDYQSVGDMHRIISLMEKIVHSTGATVAHAMESDIFGLRRR